MYCLIVQIYLVFLLKSRIIAYFCVLLRALLSLPFLSPLPDNHCAIINIVQTELHKRFPSRFNCPTFLLLNAALTVTYRKKACIAGVGNLFCSKSHQSRICQDVFHLELSDIFKQQYTFLYKKPSSRPNTKSPNLWPHFSSRSFLEVS